MSKEQNKKSKFRQSKKWRDWRKTIYHKDGGKDYITQKKLYSGYNTHHLDLRESHYQDLSDQNRFLSLNKKTHDFIHWLYIYWTKDPKILDRIETVLKTMEYFSND